MPDHNSYLGSDRFIQNTYEQVLRDQGFTDDNNSGSVQDEEADYLKTIQRIKTKGDAGYYDMTPKQQQQYDQKNSSFDSGFKLIPPAPSAPGFLKNVVGGLTGDLAPFGEQAEQRLNSVKDAERRAEIFSPVADFAEQRMNTTKDAEDSRFKKMQMLNGNKFENGERSQGDQEAEQRMVQNKKTGLLQKFVNMVTAPFNSALEKEFGTKEQPKFGGEDAVMYNGKPVHPDFYKLIMNRPDLKQRFDETGSIYGD